MIALISGKLISIRNGVGTVVTTSGVGYAVQILPSQLAKKGEDVSLFTYLAVREDALTLYGFESEDQKGFFESLIGIDGVGPKLAHSILAQAGVERIVEAVGAKDLSFFTSMKGVGKKTAQRLLLDLSSTLGGDVTLSDMALTEDDKTLVEALKSLGFAPADVYPLVGKLEKGTVEQRISAAITLLTHP